MKKYSDDTLTTRNYKIELSTDETDNGVIEGVPIVFNRATVINDFDGEFNEIIERTALDDCDLSDVLFFVNHDSNKIALARSKRGKGTMTLEVKDDGLHIRAQLDIENNTEARNLYSAIKRGDISGMSFAFRVKAQEWRDIESPTPTRIIKKISIVHEVSAVNCPAYSQTTISARGNAEAFSELAEARKAATAEAEKIENEKKLQLEKLKFTYLIGGTTA